MSEREEDGIMPSFPTVGQGGAWESRCVQFGTQ